MSALLHWFTTPEWLQIVKTLLHSLWQGALITVALALAMRRLTNPHWRYRFSLAALAAIPLAAIMTWAALNIPQHSLPAPAPILTPTETTLDLNTLGRTPDTKLIMLPNRSPAPAPFPWSAWLALAWLVGATTMLGRAGIKVTGAERLRRACQPLDNPQVTQLVAEARRAIGLVRRVRIAVTDKLTSPAVVGIIVPTLILPLTLVSTLTPEQIRFILLHELAHIRRGDYFANLFQLFVEALLFFNPAVWWISHQVRREREASCDALAIELSGAPADYARTLVHVAETALTATPEAAPAFGNEREPSSLSDRVQRLLVPGYRPSVRFTWRTMLAAFLLGTTLLVLSAEGTRIAVAQIAKSTGETKQSTAPLPSKDALVPENRLLHSDHSTNQFNLGNQKSSGSVEPGFQVDAKSIDSPELSRVKRKLHDLKFNFVVCSNRPLGEFLRELSEQSEALDEDGAGLRFSVIPIRFRTLPATIDPPLTNANLLEVLAAIQGAARLELTGLNANGLVTLSPRASLDTQSNSTRKGERDIDQRQPEARDASSISTNSSSATAQEEINGYVGDRATLVNTLLAQGITYEQWRNGYTNASQTTAVTNLVIRTGPPTRTNSDPVNISALNEHSRIEYDATTGKTWTTNGALVRVGDMTIRADSVELDQRSGKLVASGNVRIERPGLTSNRARVELNVHDDLPTRGVSAARQRILNNLDQIILDRVDFDALPLSNVVRAISAKARVLDPEGRGVNIIINPNSTPPKAGPAIDVRNIRITVNPPLLNVRLADALDAIMKCADQPLKLSIEDYAVVVSLKGTEPTPLFMREFKLAPAIFVAQLAEHGYRFEDSTSRTNSNQLTSSVRSFFASFGVDLQPSEGKAVFFNDRKGILLVRATVEELDIIEAVVQALNKPIPQVNIKARFMEIPALVMDSVSKDFLGTNLANTHGWTSILTKPQADEFLKRLKVTQGVNLLSEGEVTTVSGRQAQLQIADLKQIITGINPLALTPPGITSTNDDLSAAFQSQQIPFGPVIDVIAIAGPDEDTIDLTTICTLTEFQGYEPTNTGPVYVNNREQTIALPLPILRTLQMTHNGVVWDGQTIVLGNPTENLILMNAGGQSTVTEFGGTRTNILIVLVTPTIVDPAGNRAHSSPNINRGGKDQSFLTRTNLRPIIDRPLY